MKYLVVVISYLLGSIPFGYLICKYWKGINITEYGSGNIGFTNVFRTVGIGPGILVLIGDIGKGALAAFLGLHFGGEFAGILTGVAAILGHSFSIFLKFKGGKMVATSLGVLSVLTPKVALVALIVFIIVVGVSRYVSLASISAAFSICPSMFIFHEKLEIKIFLALAVIMVIYRHRANISRLANGTEYKIGQKLK